MKILHLNGERTWRGGEQQMCYLARGLQDRGHESHIVCRPGGACAERARAMGLTVHEMEFGSELSLAVGKRLAKIADEFGADILHAHTARTHLAAVRAAKKMKRPAKVVVHRRVDFSIHKLPLRLSGMKYRSGVDAYIAITQAVKDVMVRDGIAANLIEIIHSSTDLKRFENIARKPELRAELGLPEGVPVVGNVGALVGHKGQEYFIEAAALVAAESPDVHFVIVGEGERRAELEQLCNKLGLKEKLKMPGFRSDVPQCLKEFSIFCMSSWGEGMGSSVLEAMAMRLPVVSAAAGGLPEVIVDGVTGLLVPPRDPRALADAILRLLRDQKKAAAMGKAGRERVEKEFSVDQMVAQTIRIYQRLLP